MDIVNGYIVYDAGDCGYRETKNRAVRKYAEKVFDGH